MEPNTTIKTEETFETSESITKIAIALAEFQGKVEAVKKTAENPFFHSKYADLGNIIETIKKPLSEAKLSYVQMPTGKDILVTILMHESGEFFKTKVQMTPKDNTPQSMGSAITYYRRYCLSAILGIATEDDDDGNSASQPGAQNTPGKTVTPSKPAPTGPSKTVDALFEKAKKNLTGIKDKPKLEAFKTKINASEKYSAEQKKELVAVIDAEIAKIK